LIEDPKLYARFDYCGDETDRMNFVDLCSLNFLWIKLFRFQANLFM